MVDYRRYAPARHLEGIVEHYWSVVSGAPPGPLRAVLVPNGRATMQFCLGLPGRRLSIRRPAETNADVYLPTGTEPIVIEQEGASHYVGVQFTPWGARALFPAGPETPAQIASITGALPDKAVLATRPADELDRWLGAFLPDTRPANDLLPTATAAIDSEPSTAEVGVLCENLSVSASTMYRAFRRGVGLSPKQYIRVMRYRAFTDKLLEEASGRPAAFVAALSGYADQPHAAREFSRFTGMSAREFRNTHDGIAKLMARSE